MRQIRASILLLTALAPLTLVWAREVPEGLRKCTAEADDAKRLACFDREMASLMSDTGAPAKAAAPAAAAQASAPKAAPATAAAATTAATATAASAAKTPAATTV